MDNFTRAARFERPDRIPMTFAISDACWHHYPKEALWDLMEEHKLLFPDFRRPAPDWEIEYAPVARKGQPYTDPMGCTWPWSAASSETAASPWGIPRTLGCRGGP